MSETFLQMITEKTRAKIARVKTDHYLASVRKKADGIRSSSEPHLFKDALSRTDRTNIIAEIKRASPSKGVINATLDVSMQAARYEKGGAAGISILTESEYFQGALRDLINIRKAVSLPMLRKDFIVDEYQIYEAAAAGADAVLLIVAALTPVELATLRRVAEDELGMDALVEVHDRAELDVAVDAGSTLVGVNNRNLHSLEVSLDVSREVSLHKPHDSVFVAESGLSSRAEIDELKALGFDAFLIGESLMRSSDPAGLLEELGV